MAEARAVGDERSSEGAGNALNVPAGYKRTEAGVIPEDWCVSSLGSLLSEPPSYGINAPAVPFDGSRPTYIRITDIGSDGRFRPSPRVSVNGGGDTRFLLRSGDLVFARTGASVGKSYLYDPKDGSLVFAGFLIRVTPDAGRLLPAYIAYYVQTDHYWEWVANNSARSGQPGINSREYGSLLLPLPPLPEQRAIAAVLSDVDELIGSLEALIAKKRAIKQAAMQELLTGRTRLPGFGGEWEMRRISELATLDPENLTGSTDQGFRFNYISLDNVVAGRLVGYSRKSYGTAPTRARRVLRMRDILMSTVRPTLNGHLYFHEQVTNAVCSTGFAVLRARCDLCDPHFLFAHLFGEVVSAQLQKLLVGSSYPAINSSQVARLKVPCPRTFEEQHAIATILSDMDAEIAALDHRLDKTRAIKQGMMQQLLTGSIRLPIPDDDTEDDDAHDA